MKKRIAIVALTLALLLVAAGMVASVTSAGAIAGHFDEPRKTAAVDQAFDVTGVPTITVDERNGTIVITRGEENKVVIHAVKRAATDDLLNTLNVVARQEGNTITIQTTGESDTGFPFFGHNRTAVDYAIQVPARAEIGPVRSSNGRIEVTGIAGRLDLDTANGLITARDVDGTVTAQTSNGRVAVIGGRGMLQLRSSNGTVEVQNVQASGIDLHTSNGRITFNGSLAPGSKNRVETSNGPATLILPPESALNIDLRAGNGSVNVSFPVMATPNVENKRNAMQGIINRPDADLVMRTGNGSIALNKQGI